MKTEMGWGYTFLMLAIVLELSGTVSMKYSAGFSRMWPSVLMFLFYGASFTMLNFALAYMNVSIAYAIWSGIGIILITIVSFTIFHEKLSITSLLWIAVIVVGVVGLNMSVKSH